LDGHKAVNVGTGLEPGTKMSNIYPRPNQEAKPTLPGRLPM